MTTYSPVNTKNYYSIPATSNPNHRAQFIAATSVNLLNLHPTMKLPPVGKEYMCFKNYGKTAQADKCIKSIIMTKLIDSIILIDTF